MYFKEYIKETDKIKAYIYNGLRNKKLQSIQIKKKIN